jgi:hypothetical protein
MADPVWASGHVREPKRRRITPTTKRTESIVSPNGRKLTLCETSDSLGGLCVIVRDGMVMVASIERTPTNLEEPYWLFPEGKAWHPGKVRCLTRDDALHHALQLADRGG